MQELINMMKRRTKMMKILALSAMVAAAGARPLRGETGGGRRACETDRGL